MSQAAPARPALPSPGFLLGASMWLLPIVLGGGAWAWIAFGLIGLLARRGPWVIAAIVYALVSAGVAAASADGGDPVPTAVAGAALSAVAIVHAVIANRSWLVLLWGRRERGEAMLGPRRASGPTAVRGVDPRGYLAPAAAAQRPSALADARPGASAEHPPGSLPGPAARLAPGSPQAAALAGLFRTLEDDLHGGFADAARALPDPPAAPVPPAAAPVPSAAAPIAPLPPTPLPPTPLPITPVPLSPSLPLGGTAIPTTALPPREPLDPRAASAAELAAIPGLGPERAAALVAARDGLQLHSVDDVVRALGLQPFERVRIAPFLRFPGETSP